RHERPAEAVIVSHLCAIAPSAISLHGWTSALPPPPPRPLPRPTPSLTARNSSRKTCSWKTSPSTACAASIEHVPAGPGLGARAAGLGAARALRRPALPLRYPSAVVPQGSAAPDGRAGPG